MQISMLQMKGTISMQHWLTASGLTAHTSLLTQHSVKSREPPPGSHPARHASMLSRIRKTMLCCIAHAEPGAYQTVSTIPFVMEGGGAENTAVACRNRQIPAQMRRWLQELLAALSWHMTISAKGTLKHCRG